MTETPDAPESESESADAAAPETTRPPLRPLERPVFLLLLFGTFGLFLVLAWPLIQGRMYIEDDLAALYLPVRDFYANCLQQGYNFLWMPHLANGFYIHGEGHGGFLHPLHFVLYRFFPLDRAFMLELLVSYPVMWLGTFCFLRRWRLAHAAAAFGALLMTFIGCSMNHYVHISFVAVMAHLPWALLAIDSAMHRASPRRATLALAACALLSASQLYIGNPQVTYFSWLVEAFYALLLLGTTRRIGRLLQLGVMKVLALFIGAAQLLPTYATYEASLRQDPDLAYQLGISLHPCNLLQLVSPYLFHGRVYTPLAGDEPWDAVYLGAALVPLLLLLLVQLRALKQHRVLAIAALLLALFGFLAVLGKYGFIYHVLTRIPVVNFFRAPARYVAVLHVALAIAGACSFGLLLQLVREQRVLAWKWLAPLFLVPVASMGVLIAVVGYRLLYDGDALQAFDLHVMRSTAVAVGTILVCTATGLVVAAARGHAWAPVALVLLTIGDIGLYSMRHKPTKSLPAFMASIPLPPGGNPHRIEPDIVPYTMNQVAMQGYRSSTGYLNLFPETYLDYAQPEAMQLAGVKWREARFGTSPSLHAAKEAGQEWIELPNPMPRVRLLTEAKVTETPSQDLPSIDMEKTALVLEPVTLDGGAPGQVSVRWDSPGYIEVDCDSPGRQLLVVSENNLEGWYVTVDGERAPLRRPYGDFLGCVVPAGEHTVVFRFWPEHFTTGLLITGGAFVATVIWLSLSLYFGVRRAARKEAEAR